MHNDLRQIVTLFFCCTALAAAAEPPKDRTLAIAAIEARGGAAPDLASAAEDALTAQLVADGALRVVERQQLARVMKEQALAQSGAMSDEVQIELARLVGARWIAIGAVQTTSRGYSLSLRAMDSASAQVAFADSVKVGSEDQVEEGARQLAQRLEAKLSGGPLPAGVQSLGNFDPGEVKDGARALARSLALRMPALTGRVTLALPNDTLNCAFDGGAPFPGQFFEVRGKDEVTESEVVKGYFLLRTVSRTGCTGRVKREPGADIEEGDQLVSVPVKISVEPIEPGAGADPALAKALTEETRAAIASFPQFNLAPDPQLTALGRVSGPRGRRTMTVQVIDKKGNAVQKLELPGSF
jgi:Curli production assembly/transport component CsgG